jgi:hypothetical protein
MWKRIILGSMTVGAGKSFMIGSIKFFPLNQPVVAHRIGNIHIGYLVEIGILGTAMTPETTLILIVELSSDKCFPGYRVLLCGADKFRCKYQV